MGRTGRRTPPRAAPRPRVRALALGLVGVGALVVAAAFVLRDDGGGAPGATLTPVSGFSHVHGLAVSPTEEGVLYVATHHGLVRGENDSAWFLVGASRDDLMGFSVHPRDGRVMFASGHPASGARPNLGVVTSGDGGVTWRPLALPAVDFHAMTVSPKDPDRMWGVYAGEVYRSTDGGATWSVVGPAPPQTVAIAADPARADVVFAATTRGILGSFEGGARWAGYADGGVIAVALDPAAPGTMYAARLGGGVAKTEDDGRTWRALDLGRNATVTHLAVSPRDHRVVYAATTDDAILRSDDAGASWRAVKRAGG